METPGSHLAAVVAVRMCLLEEDVVMRQMEFS